MSNSNQTLGEFIRALRVRKEMSIHELARSTGVTQPFLTEIERGRRNPSEAVLRKLANALGIDPERLRELNATAALRDFKEIMAADHELGLAFTGMVRALRNGTLSARSVAKRLSPRLRNR